MRTAVTERSEPAAPAARARRSLVVLEVLLVIGAALGSIGLITGGLDLKDQAKDLPWQSPVLGGIALGVLNGAVPLAALVLERRHHRAAPLAHVAVGLVLVGWIVVQVALIGLTSFLQPFYLLYGIVIVALAWPGIGSLGGLRRAVAALR